MEQATRFIGLDVNKDTIVVAKATPYGTFANTAAALDKLVKRLRQAGSGPLKFCYEAEPCGYGVHRTLTKIGEDCMVVAPSMIPRKAGDRQKNDKRNAAGLAVLHRGGLLTAVWVPDTAHEAMRDLIRACPGGGAGGTPAVECVSAASRADLSRRPDRLDEGASRVAGRSEVRSPSAANRAGGEYRSRTFGRTAAGSCGGYLHAQIPT
jgi:hypothetical protein